MTGIEVAYKITVILILILFLCLTARSYLVNQLKGEPRHRADYIKDKLRIAADLSFFGAGRVEGPKGRDYIVPIGSAVLITAFGAATCLFANDLLDIENYFDSEAKWPPYFWNSILLTGLYQTGIGASAQDGAAEALHARRWQSLTVMSLAFLGAFIWSAHNIVRRYINNDLMPVEYYHTTLRLMLAPLLALMLSYLASAGIVGSDESWSTALLPVAAFMTGLIPAAVLFFLQDWFVRLLKAYGFHAHHLPLSMIEGLNRFHEVRLSEAGVDNAQNLANADLVELALVTPYPLEQLLDWIDQARLYVYLRDDFKLARDHRLRTASDLVTLKAEELKAIQEVDGLARLGVTAHLISNDPNQKRVEAWRKALSSSAKAA
jgi:hypothetical protein